MDMIGALRCFLRVAETGSFSAASRACQISQSAVTRQVAQLEQHFGARLFHRTTRHISLTDDGQNLLDHARQLVDSVDQMEEALGRQSVSPSGLVRLGTTIAGGLFLAPRLPLLLARHPGLKIELVMRDQMTDMVADALDLELRAGQVADASLIARRIGDTGRVVVATPAYLEQHRTPCTPAELAEHTCLIHSSMQDPYLWQFVGPDGPLSVQVSGAFIANDSVAVLRSARAGHGIALLPEVEVVDDLHSGRLCRLLIDYPSQTAPVYILYPSRRHLAPRTRVVMDFVVEQVQTTQALLASGVDVLI